jgi:uncharacterized protein (TIGR02246 family)
MNQAQLAAEYAEAWADHDPDAIVSLHTEDTVFHLHGDLRPATGRQAFGTWLRGCSPMFPICASTRDGCTSAMIT